MYGVILVSTLLASSLAAPSSPSIKDNERITDGITGSIYLFPYHVSLRSSDGWLLCSGALIDAKWVVTAASCTSRLSGILTAVGAGSNSAYLGDGPEMPVQNVYQHPGFDPETLDNDIALLELQYGFEFTETVNKVGLPEEGQAIAAQSLANITGWGRTYENGNFPAVLLANWVNILDTEECRAAYGENAITSNMICAGRSDGSANFCQGDEGGPLVANNVLIGVISWGTGCARPGIPAVYASVPALRSFIAEITGF